MRDYLQNQNLFKQFFAWEIQSSMELCNNLNHVLPETRRILFERLIRFFFIFVYVLSNLQLKY